ncbi:MAG: type I 3-dehydroquinate dehydratase, partial [Candidatus Bathyarchaeia archaeon]
MKLKICGVAAASAGETLRELIRKADQTTVDLIEIRIDYLDDFIEPAEIRKQTSKPLIATNRPRWEGGFFRGGEPERIDTLTLAAAAGFDYVDVESKTKDLKALVGRLRRLGAKSIISFHDQKATPTIDRLLSIYNAQVKSGATVCKIVTKATRPSDNLRLFRLLESSQRRKP